MTRLDEIQAKLDANDARPQVKGLLYFGARDDFTYLVARVREFEQILTSLQTMAWEQQRAADAITNLIASCFEEDVDA